MNRNAADPNATHPNEPDQHKEDRQAQIRQKAHDLWIAEGKPSGQAARHWQMAEQSLDEPLPAERAQQIDYKGKRNPRREA